MANYRDLSKFISLILRHKPEVIGISLDDHGWANVDELLAGIRRTSTIDTETLEENVRTDQKQRYTFNEDHARIRANQGHSIQVDVELEEKEPPEYLFHGTGRKYVESIDQTGLIPKSRLYVHLSGDQETAIKVGKRHGEPIVYQVAAGAMARDGHKFWRSANDVWLTKRVPPEYLEKM